ncbi:growth/differentiation factor 5 [Hippocampus zosterae]|uniref:growth/differentiation factor 5 n=1 Tax=Hippocampus zosterae TaxID=109293 RepID=UPI00223E04CD|nr:growth/differentiation factor 5 [Hippocampus zosterae]
MESAISRAASHQIAMGDGGMTSVKVTPHDYMMSLYQMGSSESARRNFSMDADTVTSFVDSARDELGSVLWYQRYQFQISSLDQDGLVGAELRILRKRSARQVAAGEACWLNLYSCGSGPQKVVLIQTLAAAALEPPKGKWEVFDVYRAVKALKKPSQQNQNQLKQHNQQKRPNQKQHSQQNQYSQNNHQNQKHHVQEQEKPHPKSEPEKELSLCFHLEAVESGGGGAADLLGLGFGRAGRAQKEKAFLLAYSRSDRGPDALADVFYKEIRARSGHARKSIYEYLRSQRRLRRAPHARPHSPPLHCRRVRLHVDFRALGWDDWIIAPLDYQAFRCGGSCDFPLRSHLQPTNHAVVQTLLHTMAPPTAPPACCVPTRLSAISVLYVDADDNVVYRQYRNMVVDACGCR